MDNVHCAYIYTIFVSVNKEIATNDYMKEILIYLQIKKKKTSSILKEIRSFNCFRSYI